MAAVIAPRSARASMLTKSGSSGRHSFADLGAAERIQESMMENWHVNRKRAYAVLYSRFFTTGMSIVILFNTVIVVFETDLRGKGTEPPRWMKGLSASFLVGYALESILRMYVDRENFTKSVWNLFDITLVGADIIGSIVESLVGNVPSVSVFRLFRVVRVVRVFRALTGFRELFMMLHGLAAAMKAIIWATIMILVALLFWSLIAVELIHPLVEELHSKGKFDETCFRCPQAFSTVWKSNLTLLQTVLAGDSWGKMAIPLGEEHPLTVVFFMGSFVSVNLGIMNLIVAVIVDRAHQAREEDDLQRLMEKEDAFQEAKKRMGQIFSKLDKDNSGTLTCDELVGGMETEPEFANLLSLMDINPEDLSLVFKVLDRDGSGELDYLEFCEQLYKMKTHDAHTMLVFVRHQVSQINSVVADIFDFVHDMDDVLKPKRKAPAGNGNSGDDIVKMPEKQISEEGNGTSVNGHFANGCELDDVGRRVCSEVKATLLEEIPKLQELCVSELRGAVYSYLQNGQLRQPGEAISDCFALPVQPVVPGASPARLPRSHQASPPPREDTNGVMSRLASEIVVVPRFAENSRLRETIDSVVDYKKIQQLDGQELAKTPDGQEKSSEMSPKI